MAKLKFTRIALPQNVKGKLFIHGMPGRFEHLAAFNVAAQEHGIRKVVALPPLAEMREKSPVYAEAVVTGVLPYEVRQHPLPDHGAPRDGEALLALAQEVSGDLRGGMTVLIHCASGINRTGLVTVLVLCCLGETLPRALRKAHDAGCWLEPAQETAARSLTASLWPNGNGV